MPIYNPPKQSNLGTALQTTASVAGMAALIPGAQIPAAIIGGVAAIGSAIVGAQDKQKQFNYEQRYNMLNQREEALNRSTMNNSIVQNGFKRISDLSSFSQDIGNGTNITNNRLV